MTTSRSALDSLRSSKYVAVTTYRKSGEAVVTPVSYHLNDGRIVFFSRSDAGKLKRIRNNQTVEFASCSVRGKVVGQTFAGTARILNAQETAVAIEDAKRHRPLIRILALLPAMKNQVGTEITVAPS